MKKNSFLIQLKNKEKKKKYEQNLNYSSPDKIFENFKQKKDSSKYLENINGGIIGK